MGKWKKDAKKEAKEKAGGKKPDYNIQELTEGKPLESKLQNYFDQQIKLYSAERIYSMLAR